MSRGPLTAAPRCADQSNFGSNIKSTRTREQATGIRLQASGVPIGRAGFGRKLEAAWTQTFSGLRPEISPFTTST